MTAPNNNYIQINRTSWDNKVDIHLASDFYAMDDFLIGKTSLKEIELALLGNINQQKLLHLQCHFGQDSISLSRMGAEVHGVDFSEKAILKAQELAKKLNSSATFSCCNIYDLARELNDVYDIVFTSYGTVIWLRDLKKWAKTIHHFLIPGGRFIMVDFHPFVWMYDEHFKDIIYPYFSEEAIEEIESGSYAEPTAKVQNKTITWNHGLAEIIQSLLETRLVLKDFQEYLYAPYPFVKGCEEFEKGKYR